MKSKTKSKYYSTQELDKANVTVGIIMFTVIVLSVVVNIILS